jgi:hypothetical protein
MEHHADFAIPITHRLHVDTVADPDDGHGPLEGQAIALGWWVDPGAADDPGHVPTGTLYLVVDKRRPRPMWVKQADLRAVRIDESQG